MKPPNALPNVSIVEWAVAEQRLAGSQIYTQKAIVKSTPNGTLLAVIDGLEHTPEAQHAVEMVNDVLQNYTHQTLIELIAKCDHACKGTRGCVVSTAIINTSFNTITWYGIGNIEVVLIAGSPLTEPPYQRLPQQTGLVGEGLRSLREGTVPIKRGDVIVFATEAIKVGFAQSLKIDGRPRTIGDQIIAQHVKPDADAIALVARYLGLQKGKK